MEIYIVENCNDGGYECFKTLEQANQYVRGYYKAYMAEWYKNMSTDECLANISTDLGNLNAAMAYIEDVMYVAAATLHE